MAGSQISPCFLKDGAGGDMNFISSRPRAPVPHLTATAIFFGPWYYSSANSEEVFVRALSLFCLYLREDCLLDQLRHLHWPFQLLSPGFPEGN